MPDDLNSGWGQEQPFTPASPTDVERADFERLCEQVGQLAKAVDTLRSSVTSQLKSHSHALSQLRLQNRVDHQARKIEKLQYELSRLKSSFSFRWVRRINNLLVWLHVRKAPPQPPAWQTPTYAKPRSEASPARETSTAVEEPQKVFTPAPPARTARELRVAAILDTFSHACFEPEAQLLTFRPDNWQDVLTATPPHLLLVESAWHGNDGSWQYRVASYQKNMGNELQDLIDWCRKRNIPTVFWNKEDPVHFERFIERAKLFDVVLTTDANCIERYRQALGHDRVHALPFAAQPRIHNPLLRQPRVDKACFAGTYYATRHQHRQGDMDVLLLPALALGLDIYDRMHGAVGKQAQEFRFPDIYQPCIRGRLEYDQMLDAYRQYRVFLNVNSVKDSPTMFSRRVFELLACGTPVISTPSVGIQELLGQQPVRIVETAEQSTAAIGELMQDDEAWARASALGIRKVMRSHTYGRRMELICKAAGVAYPRSDAADVHAFVSAEPKEQLRQLAADLAAQKHCRVSLTLVVNGPVDAALLAEITQIMSFAEGGHTVDAAHLAELPERLAALSDDAVIACLAAGNYYGPCYLSDAMAALDYSGKNRVGRAAHFALSGGRLELIDPDKEHFAVSEILGATLLARRKAIDVSLLEQALAGGMLGAEEGSFYASNRYEFVAAAGDGRSDAVLEPARLQES